MYGIQEVCQQTLRRHLLRARGSQQEEWPSRTDQTLVDQELAIIPVAV